MEITTKDLQFFKLSPTLIFLIKCIHSKDNELLIELNKVSSINDMVKYLEKNLFIKIINDKIECDSFQIRRLDIIKYLSEKNSKYIDGARLIFDHFIKVTEKYSHKKSGMKFNTYKDWLKSRIKAGISIEESNKIIDMKFNQWYNDANFQKHLNFQTLIGPKHYLQNVQQLELSNQNEKPKTFNINKMI